jgi:hypothetical protein
MGCGRSYVRFLKRQEQLKEQAGKWMSPEFAMLLTNPMEVLYEDEE